MSGFACRRAEERPCLVPGCSEAGIPCHIPAEGRYADDGTDLADWYCPTHAREYGYCVACGTFVAGEDVFERNGMCEHCQAEADENDRPGDEDDDWPEFDPYQP
ncbi:MAG TPA: hypothetical protein VEA41_00045 [Salinarimonas sp.]|nr:hypothetical protein [Salinarimonas sp.]